MWIVVARIAFAATGSTTAAPTAAAVAPDLRIKIRVLILAQLEGEDYIWQPDAAIFTPTAGILGQQFAGWEIAEALVIVRFTWLRFGLGYGSRWCFGFVGLFRNYRHKRWWTARWHSAANGMARGPERCAIYGIVSCTATSVLERLFGAARKVSKIGRGHCESLSHRGRHPHDNGHEKRTVDELLTQSLHNSKY